MNQFTVVLIVMCLSKICARQTTVLWCTVYVYNMVLYMFWCYLTLPQLQWQFQ